MRAFFLLLVLANLAFFAWANFFTEADTQSDPRPMARQIAADKLHIVAPSALAPPSPPVPSAPAGEQAPAGDAARPGAGNGGGPETAAKIACLEWGGFGPAEAARAAEALAPLSLGTRLTQRQVEDNAGWWVFIGPRATRQDAQKKAGELKALGVDDYFILQDEGTQRYLLSLGVFRTETAAANRLEALRAKGVKTAQVGKRETAVSRTYFQVRQAEEAVAGKLRELAPGFPGSTVADCAATPG